MGYSHEAVVVSRAQPFELGKLSVCRRGVCRYKQDVRGGTPAQSVEDGSQRDTSAPAELDDGRIEQRVVGVWHHSGPVSSRSASSAASRSALRLLVPVACATSRPSTTTTTVNFG